MLVFFVLYVHYLTVNASVNASVLSFLPRQGKPEPPPDGLTQNGQTHTITAEPRVSPLHLDLSLHIHYSPQAVILSKFFFFFL